MHAKPTIRRIGGIALGIGAVVHLQLWSDSYRHIPKIGPLFIAQGTVGLLLAVAMLAIGSRLLALAGAALALATLVGYGLSRTMDGVFGFREISWTTEAVVAFIAETAAMVLLLGCYAAQSSVPASKRSPATLAG
jgi:hypothetical protein